MQNHALPCYESSALASQNPRACSETNSARRVWSGNLITPTTERSVVGLVLVAAESFRIGASTLSSNGIAAGDKEAQQSDRNGPEPSRH